MFNNIIELAELGNKYYGYTDKKQKAIRKKLKELGVTIQTDRIRHYVFEDEFLQVFNKVAAKPPKQTALAKGLVLTDLKTIKTKQMENITLKEKEQETGLFLICKCKNKYKHEGLIDCSCTNFKYYARIYVPKSKPVKQTLAAKTIIDAKIELLNIKKQIEAGTYKKPESTVVTVQKPEFKPVYNVGQQQPQFNSPTLMEAIEIYLNYLEVKKNRSTENNKEAERFLHMLVYVLDKLDYRTSKMLFTDINDNTISDAYCEFLKIDTNWNFKGEIVHKDAYQPPTFNKAVGRMSSFSSAIIDLCKLVGFPNMWSKFKVSRIQYGTNPEQFPPSKFADLINKINKENGWSDVKKRRNLYYPFLKDAYLFGLITGGRRDVVAYATFKNVQIEDGVVTSIKVEKYKENRQKGLHLLDPQYRHYWTIKMNPKLLEFLTERGLFDNIDSDEFIIAPEEPSRELIKRYGLTNGFTHFSKLATGRKYKFCQLRKTNFTAQVNDYLSGLIKELNVEHRNIKTTLKHYVDKRA